MIQKSSFLEQLEEAEKYLKLNNKIAGKIVNFERIDKLDYPNEVLRECLLNCIGHRNYEIPGSTLVHIFKTSIEFLSLGGLVKGLTIEDIKLGSSSSRNPKLVSILHRLGLVEAYGSGIPRIIEFYKKQINQPEIKVAPNSFLLKIPKLNSNKNYDLVINYLNKNKTATRDDIEKVLKVKKTTAGEILKEKG
ncbi:MAG: ATP-binding protein [Bacilli bacterium]|nr:ATP-binding protein [Bacilli bacterium]